MTTLDFEEAASYEAQAREFLAGQSGTINVLRLVSEQIESMAELLELLTSR